MKVLPLFYALVSFVLLSACSSSEDASSLTALTSQSVILSYGDSLTFGTGAGGKEYSYPAVLAKLTGLEVHNRGIPGEVSKEGLARLSSVLQETQPDLVILCHGGNDLIQKLGETQLKDNLDQMIGLIKASGAEVVLVAVPKFSIMLTPPELYQQLAIEHQIPVALQLLTKIERKPELKSDQIHPNAAGYKLFAEQIQQLLTQSSAL